MIVGLHAASRTSGGGHAFRECLSAALLRSPTIERLVLFTADPSWAPDSRQAAGARLTIESTPAPSGMGGLVDDVMSMPARARRHNVDVLLCPGNRLVRVPGSRSIMWPLTVAPFDPVLRRWGGDGGSRRSGVRTFVRVRAQARLVVSSCRQAHGVIFSSHTARGLIEAAADLHGTPTTVVPPAATLTPREVADEPRRPPPRGWPWGEAPFLLFVSHLYPYKMVAELVEGFAAFLSTTGAPHHLAVAGRAVDAAYLERIRQGVTAGGVGGRVHLLGAVDPAQLGELYRRCACFVFPSLCENAGSYALLDAFAHGRPVLSSSLSSMPEVCGDAALYFDPRDPDAIAERMLQVARDDALADDLARRSRERAAELPSWDDVASGVVSFAQRWC
ncbi:MAG: glycosyltransferase family 4 protein [Actinobacteria bacterium]|nr:glycosyltransferase family 4 protein [Actinomycetota bacterium]